MAKIKAKQIGEVASGLALESTAISYYQTNPTDYQIAPVAAPALLVADTTLRNLAVFADAVVAEMAVVTDAGLLFQKLSWLQFQTPSIRSRLSLSFCLLLMTVKTIRIQAV